ncbi:MAG TPA: hypothetical protein DCQ06_04560 [Myxococcales bacterium]|nr:hypothetical protein [Myxococcales bacterium]HAN30847.1 hypothetical protein [Myxococcales bacterium]
MSDAAPQSRGQAWMTAVGRWAPSSQVLTLWALWWLWRYGAVSALPGFDEASAMVALGFLVDALALDGLVALLRFRRGDLVARGRKLRWARGGFGALLMIAALLRAADGLNCYLAQRHVDAKFWAALDLSTLWGLRYVVGAALATGAAAWWLLGQELARSERMLERVPAHQRSGWLHTDAIRAALGLVSAAWLSVALSEQAARWVAPSEWWSIGSLLGL